VERNYIATVGNFGGNHAQAWIRWVIVSSGGECQCPRVGGYEPRRIQYVTLDYIQSIRLEFRIAVVIAFVKINIAPLILRRQNLLNVSKYRAPVLIRANAKRRTRGGTLEWLQHTIVLGLPDSESALQLSLVFSSTHIILH
jgi:hypothetical protein